MMFMIFTDSEHYWYEGGGVKNLLFLKPVAIHSVPTIFWGISMHFFLHCTDNNGKNQAKKPYKTPFFR